MSLAVGANFGVGRLRDVKVRINPITTLTTKVPLASIVPPRATGPGWADWLPIVSRSGIPPRGAGTGGRRAADTVGEKKNQPKTTRGSLWTSSLISRSCQYGVRTAYVAGSCVSRTRTSFDIACRMTTVVKLQGKSERISLIRLGSNVAKMPSG